MTRAYQVEVLKGMDVDVTASRTSLFGLSIKTSSGNGHWYIALTNPILRSVTMLLLR